MKPKPPIDALILTVRGMRVMLSTDLANIYGVEVRALNQAVKRNAVRFPGDFVFQLTQEEVDGLTSLVGNGKAEENLKSQIVISSWGGARRALPYAFTEHGALMAATVLNSPEAVAMSVYVVRAFMHMREQLAANASILKRLAEIDQTLLEHDQALRGIWHKLQPLLQPPPDPPRRRIGFHTEGQAG